MKNRKNLYNNKKTEKIIFFFIVITIMILNIKNTYGQETLQTVTNAGSSTDQRIALHNALELDVIGTPNDNFSNSYLSQYAYTTVNGATNKISSYVLLQTQGAYWHDGASGLGFYNKGPYTRPIMEVISGDYGNFSTCLPQNCAIRNNFIYQFIAGTVKYKSRDNLITEDNSEVLYGVRENRKFYINKGLMIGTVTDDANSMLQVNGNIIAKKLTIIQTGWPDYVFDSTYHLSPLSELSIYIKTNHHLPGFPSSKEIESEGLDLGKMQKKQMQKIEEMILYLIKMNKKQVILERRIEKLESLNQELVKQIQNLKSTER